MFVKTHSKNAPLLYKRFSDKACSVEKYQSLVNLNEDILQYCVTQFTSLERLTAIIAYICYIKGMVARLA